MRVHYLHEQKNKKFGNLLHTKETIKFFWCIFMIRRKLLRIKFCIFWCLKNFLLCFVSNMYKMQEYKKKFYLSESNNARLNNAERKSGITSTAFLNQCSAATMSLLSIESIPKLKYTLSLTTAVCCPLFDLVDSDPLMDF